MTGGPQRWGWTADTSIDVELRSDELAFDQVIVAHEGGSRVLTPEAFFALPLDERIRLSFEKRVRFLKDSQPVSSRDAMKSVMTAARRDLSGL